MLVVTASPVGPLENQPIDPATAGRYAPTYDSMH